MVKVITEFSKNIYARHLSRVSFFWLGIIIEVLFLLFYTIEPWRKSTYDFEIVLKQDKLFMALVAILSSALFFYVLAIIKSRNVEPSLNMVVGFVLLFSLTMFFVWPNGSSDLFSYIGQGRVMSVHQQNPYTTHYSDMANDTWRQSIDTVWSQLPMIYGPVFAWVTKFFTQLGADSLFLTMALFKLLGLACFLLSAWFVYLITKSSTALMLFAWNPLVIYEAVANAHNDIFVVVLLMAALLVMFYKKDWSRGRYFVGLFFISLACLIKAIPLVILPVVTVYAMRKENSIKKAAAIFFGSVVFVLIIFILAYTPYWQGAEIFGLLLYFVQKFSNPLPSVLIWIASSVVALFTGAWNVNSVIFFFRIIFVVAFAWVLVRILIKSTKPQKIDCLSALSWSIFLFYFLFANWLMPWYFLILILVLVLLYIETRNETTAVMIGLSSIYAISIYFIIR